MGKRLARAVPRGFVDGVVAMQRTRVIVEKYRECWQMTAFALQYVDVAVTVVS